jgi:uncharacterized protein YcbK (DUF882 family)
MATRHRLSKHFVVEEFDCHNGTKCRPADYKGLEYMARQHLEPMRKKYGPVKIMSGYRTRAYNAKIGGASRSYHIYPEHPNDQACDIICQRGTPVQWHSTLNWIRKHKRGGKGGLGLYKKFCHIDLREYKADWRG